MIVKISCGYVLKENILWYDNKFNNEKQNEVDDRLSLSPETVHTQRQINNRYETSHNIILSNACRASRSLCSGSHGRIIAHGDVTCPSLGSENNTDHYFLTLAVVL